MADTLSQVIIIVNGARNNLLSYMTEWSSAKVGYQPARMSGSSKTKMTMSVLKDPVKSFLDAVNAVLQLISLYVYRTHIEEEYYFTTRASRHSFENYTTQYRIHLPPSFIVFYYKNGKKYVDSYLMGVGQLHTTYIEAVIVEFSILKLKEQGDYLSYKTSDSESHYVILNELPS
ncbi:hypothetical protein BDC45DRAFT_534251 [Circinella umbellata]|nr:hypothetical protein BDC45DRAFT_534251 [Circinella umbellata]